MQRFLTDDSGQSVVEVALFTPVILTLLIGAINLGRYAQFDQRLTSAARAGAQYGATNLVTANNIAGMQSAGLNDISNMSGITVTASNYCKCADGTSTTCTAGACPSNHRLLYVTVSAKGTFKPTFTGLGVFSAGAITRTATLQVGQ